MNHVKMELRDYNFTVYVKVSSNVTVHAVECPQVGKQEVEGGSFYNDPQGNTIYGDAKRTWWYACFNDLKLADAYWESFRNPAYAKDGMHLQKVQVKMKECNNINCKVLRGVV